MKIFLNLDLAGAEWVIVAYLSGDPAMLSVVESGNSPHTSTGEFMFKLPYAEIAREDKELDGVKDPTKIAEWRAANWANLNYSTAPIGSSVRFGAKTCNHSLNYGLQAPAFSERYDLPIAEARRLVKLYRNTAYPGVVAWNDAIKAEIHEYGYLTNCFGRRRPFYGDITMSTYLQGYAFKPQSTVFDITRIAMVKAHKNPDFTMCMQVHDSIVGTVECDVTRIRDVTLFLLDCLTVPITYNNKTFTLNTDCKLGFRLNKRMMIEYKPTIDSIKHAIEKASKFMEL